MIYGISSNRCPICIAPPDQFGELLNASYATRPHPTHAAAFHHSDIHILNSHGVKNINNVLWHIPIEPHEIVRPDILHVLLLSMLVHLMKWVQEFLDHVGRLTIFDHTWSRLSPFPGFSRPNKAYRSVSQWQGKEIRNLCHVLLAAFAAALSQTSDTSAMASQHKVLCHNAILCVWYLTDFILMAQYRVHTHGIIESIKDYLQDFHAYKDVFLRFRASKAVKAAAKEASRDLREEHSQLLTSDKPQGKISSKRRKLTQELRLETEELVHNFLTTRANYNFSKMHLISHFIDQISKYGSLPQYATKIYEASHKPFKDVYWRSNHLNAIPQIIRTYAWVHSFSMREKNLEQ